MQNLALSSQFNNSGRRGNLSSNSFNSLVLNGVLPPNEDGRVEGIQLFDPKHKKYKQYNGRTTNSAGLGPSGVAFDEWGIQPDDMFGDPNSGSGGSVDGPAGRGGIQGGEDEDRENWDPHNTGGTIRINFPLVGQGFVGPRSLSAEEAARIARNQRINTEFNKHFDYSGDLSQEIISSLTNAFVSLLLNATQGYTDLRDHYSSYSELKDVIQSLILDNGREIKDLANAFINNPSRKSNDSKKLATVLTQNLNIPFRGGVIHTIKIEVRITMVDGQPRLEFFATFIGNDLRGNSDVVIFKDFPIYSKPLE